jgi:hypothetical protein
MQVIKTYLYPNLLMVQFMDPTLFAGGRNRIVYNRTIKVYQGIDNPIQIVCLNQDQKPVDLTGYSVQVDIQDPTNQQTINSYAVSFANITTGQGSIVLDQTTLDSLENRLYKLTVKQILISSGEASPVYIDDNYGVPLDLMVLPAYYSSTAPAASVTEGIVVDGGTL